MSDRNVFDVGMDRDQIVPGLPGFLQLVAPDSFERFEITINVGVRSMNTNDIRSAWRGFHTAKKAWEDRLQQDLMVARVPKGNLRAIAGGILRMPTRRRRDSGNYATLLDKALGDALTFSGDPSRPVEQRYIPDDDPGHYFFAGVEFEEEPGPHRTRIVLFTQPREESHGS